MKSAQITLHSLEIPLHLGWSAEERTTPQSVIFDINIHFPSPPKACLTDELTDTHCYDVLVKQIKAYLKAKEFRLLEHLGQAVFVFIQSLLPDSKINLRVKKQTQIPNLTGGVTFQYGDS